MNPRVKLVAFSLFAALAFAVLLAGLLIDRPVRLDAPAWNTVNRVASVAAAPKAPSTELPLEPRSGRQNHIHAAFRLSASGGFWGAPTDLGLTQGGQVLAIHTHDGTGVVHLHRAPGVKPFTLSQVLSLWGIPVRGDRILGYPARIKVNGRAAPPSYRLQNRDDVVVYLAGGDPLPRFNWSRVPLGDKP